MENKSKEFKFSNGLIALLCSGFAVFVVSFVYSRLVLDPEDPFQAAFSVLWVLAAVAIAAKVVTYVPRQLWIVVVLIYMVNIGVATVSANVGWLMARQSVFNYDLALAHDPVADKIASGLAKIQLDYWDRVQKHPGFLWYTPVKSIPTENADPVFDEHVFLLFGSLVVCVGVALWDDYRYKPPLPT